MTINLDDPYNMLICYRLNKILNIQDKDKSYIVTKYLYLCVVINTYTLTKIVFFSMYQFDQHVTQFTNIKLFSAIQKQNKHVSCIQ